jgi:membrane-bound lytic murein transglycosylase D
MKYILLTVLNLILINLAFAFELPKDTIVQDQEEGQQIEEDLDKMLNLWYVKNSTKAYDIKLNASNKNAIKNYSDTETAISNISDSVIIERLKAIPSLVDLPYNEIIRKWIEVYTRRKSAPVLLGLADYYFPMFEEILDKYNLPVELKYLPIIESALNPRAVSRAGATGMWQFMYGTGRIYQLEINSFVDERRDPYSSTVAAAKFLSHLYEVYQDWTLVIAAYNCGPGNVNKAIKRANGKHDYWDIYPYLPRETRGYVPAFIGAAYMMNYYDAHQIEPLKIGMPATTDTIIISKRLHLQQVADVLGISIEELRDLNPQYKQDIIPATGYSYPLRLPFEFSMAFVDNEDSIYNYKDSIFFNSKNIAVAAIKSSGKSKYYGASSNRYSYSPPSTENMTKLKYTVKEGDNLGFICSWYNVKVSDVRYWNNIRKNKIIVGQDLAIYVPNKKVPKYREINTMSFEQKNLQNAKSNSSNNSNPASLGSSAVNKADNSYITYTVQKGDSPWTIAQKFTGVTDQDILRINNLTKTAAKNLKAGQVLKIKKKG